MLQFYQKVSQRNRRVFVVNSVIDSSLNNINKTNKRKFRIKNLKSCKSSAKKSIKNFENKLLENQPINNILEIQVCDQLQLFNQKQKRNNKRKMAPNPSSSTTTENFNTFISVTNPNNVSCIVKVCDKIHQNNNQTYEEESALKRWRVNAIVSASKNLSNIFSQNNEEECNIDELKINSKQKAKNLLSNKTNTTANKQINNLKLIERKPFLSTTLSLSDLSPPPPSLLSRCIPSNSPCSSSFLNSPLSQTSGYSSNYSTRSTNLSMASLSLLSPLQKKSSFYDPVKRMDEELCRVREAPVKVI